MEKVTRTVKSYVYDVTYVDMNEEAVKHTTLNIPEKNDKKALAVAKGIVGEHIVEMKFTGVTDEQKYAMSLTKFMLNAEVVE